MNLKGIRGGAPLKTGRTVLLRPGERLGRNLEGPWRTYPEGWGADRGEYRRGNRGGARGEAPAAGPGGRRYRCGGLGEWYLKGTGMSMVQTTSDFFNPLGAALRTRDHLSDILNIRTFFQEPSLFFYFVDIY